MLVLVLVLVRGAGAGAGVQLTVRACACAAAERGTRTEPDGGVYWTHDIMLQAKSVSYLSLEQMVGTFKQITCPSLLVTGTNGWPLAELEV